MKAITSAEMKELEIYAAGIGIPSRILMEIAGMKVANIAAHEIKHAETATIICGTGGNGGDGFVAARYLRDAGIKVTVHILGQEGSISSDDSRANLNILKALGVTITEITAAKLQSLNEQLLLSDIVIDAIYGIGFKGEISDIPAKVIGLINDSRKSIKDKRPYSILSIDVPSGINATDGSVSSICIKADITVTFECPKIGLFKYPASSFAGKILTTSIGIPKPNTNEPHLSTSADHNIREESGKGIMITDSTFVSSLLPRYKADAHKGNRGRVLVIAGSSGMMGAAVLSANSALRAGSGLVTLCVPREIKNNVNSMSLEVVVSDFNNIDEQINICDAIAIGPGLAKDTNAIKLVNSLLLSKKIRMPIVIDADALNAIKDPSILKKSGLDIVITPHAGEFSRLSSRSIDDIQHDRTGSARLFAAEYGVTVLLKGAYTVIAGKDGKIFINPIANPAMATAGVGDVLTGIIASLIGQGLSSFNAAVAGAYIHGMSAGLATSIKGRCGIIASDIIDLIPNTLETML